MDSDDFGNIQNCAVNYLLPLVLNSIEVACYSLLFLVALPRFQEALPVVLFLAFSVISSGLWFSPGNAHSLQYKIVWWVQFALQTMLLEKKLISKWLVLGGALVTTAVGIVFSFPLSVPAFFLDSVFHYLIACLFLISIRAFMTTEKEGEEMRYIYGLRFVSLLFVLLFAFLGEYYDPSSTSITNLFWFVQVLMLLIYLQNY